MFRVTDMTEVFRSEAHNAHFNCVGQTILCGFLLGFTCFSFVMWTADKGNILVTLALLALTGFTAHKADRNYKIVKRYIQYPPNCHIEERKNVK